MLTTKEIQQIIGKNQVEKGHSPVVTNLSFLAPAEMDVMSMSGSGYMYEFEVKISKADFKKDSEKYKKHALFEARHSSVPNYFYYVCPLGLIKAPEIPSYAGLIYINGNEAHEVVKAPLIHKEKHNLLKVLQKVCRVQSERLFLGGCKLTVKNIAIKDRKKQRLMDAGFSGDLLIKALKK